MVLLLSRFKNLFISYFGSKLWVNFIKLLIYHQIRGPIDPSIDEESPVFSYYSKPVYELGIRNSRFASAITPDSTIFTGSGEYIFFIGKELRKFKRRIWTLYKGYLPLFISSIRDGPVEYEIRVFHYWLDEKEKINANFVKVVIRNIGNSSEDYSFGIGYSFMLTSDHRPISLKRDKFTKPKIEFKGNYAIANDRIIYYLNEKPNKVFARINEPYSSPFILKRKNDIVCISVFEGRLKPGEEKEITFIIPHFAVNESKLDLFKISWKEAKNKFEKYWESFVSKAMKIYVSEEKVVNTYKTSIIYDLIAQEEVNGEVIQAVNRFQYNKFWIRDSAFIARMFLVYGFPEIAKGIIKHMLRYQKEDGNFLSQSGQYDGWGQVLWAIGEYLRFTRDVEFAKEIYPNILRALRWFIKSIKEDPLYLIPLTTALDNEQAIGHYTGHNIWAITGLESIIFTLQLLGKEKLRRLVESLLDEFKKNFIKLARHAFKKAGYLPPILDFIIGFDWGNLLLLYPTLIFDKNDEIVEKTLEHFRSRMREWIATYGPLLHDYIGERVAQTYLVIGRQREALEIFYGMLLHTGSANDGFEFFPAPWGDRDYVFRIFGRTPIVNYPPHGWFAANFNNLLRNMLLREERRELHLLSAISPAWFKEGEKIIVKNAPTYFGVVAFEVDINKEEFRIKIRANWKEQPERIVIHVPYFIEVKDLSTGELTNDKIYLGPNVEEVSVKFSWKIKSAISYETFVKVYKRLYREAYMKKHLFFRKPQKNKIS